MRNAYRLLVAFCLCSLFAKAQEAPFPYPPEIRDAKVEVYKTLGDVRLNLYIFNPPGSAPSAKRAAIVFFFGGGWNSGSPAQFETQCRHMASLGMVAIAADFRVGSRHNSTAADSVRDAKSAIRYVRSNAAVWESIRSASRLGVAPRGGSSPQPPASSRASTNPRRIKLSVRAPTL